MKRVFKRKQLEVVEVGLWFSWHFQLSKHWEAFSAVFQNLRTSACETIGAIGACTYQKKNIAGYFRVLSHSLSVTMK